ncbi:Y-family DNA polymerase [Patulibacter defluvii]|uniref:Y-family DNA polymerase n=1 Tax=Patulibacter defluvii TaxID=3095358 RepID=UPI002A75BE98|nr:hypothetical protein [Patulibacter sp. DM4]
MSSVVCVHFPRLPLVVAADGHDELLGVPIALAPQAGQVQRIGLVSPAAEALGVRPGQTLGEALACCPRLRLLPPDPVAVEVAWEAIVQRLEGIGAAVDVGPVGGTTEARVPGATGATGTAWFAAAGIRRLHGGTLAGTAAAIHGAIREPVRIGVAPTRFLARVAAGRARQRHPMVVEPPAMGTRVTRGRLGHGVPVGGLLPPVLADEPIAALGLRRDLAELVQPLERLGIATLGALAALPSGAVGERFGRPGLIAQELLRGQDEPLRPRDPPDRIEADLRLPEAASGEQLGQALGLLIDRVLADPRRRHRPLRSLVLQAHLVERGTWQERIVLREAMVDPQRIRLALGLRLALLPSPAERLTLRVDGFGAPVPADRPLLEEAEAVRRARLREAVHQVREVAGAEAALRVVEVDPGSRMAERRMALTPFEA